MSEDEFYIICFYATCNPQAMIGITSGDNEVRFLAEWDWANWGDRLAYRQDRDQ
jgi:hypothetical protein